MAEFSELIKKFDKIRDYMRDFYVYGFKTRADFTKKSARTYDNEKRRCESYLGEYMKWDYSGGSKTSFISVDCANIPVNPLFAAWKSKSFTSNDIVLHFYILDALRAEFMPIERLTDTICENSEMTFDAQTVRNKCNEYVKLGLLTKEKHGKAFFYGIYAGDVQMTAELLDAIKFFQGVAVFGEVGSYILDNENQCNDLFSFKHNYITHTLESGVLFDLLSAIRQNRAVIIENQSERSGKTSIARGLPLSIFVSATTGRRYVCMYTFRKNGFTTFRLDYVKTVLQDDVITFADELKEKLNSNLHRIWGVSPGGLLRPEILCMKLHIDEKREQYILERVRREGQNGELLRLDENTFLYTTEVFDSTDMSPWIKTFIGRIIGLEGTNRMLVDRFYGDIKRMARRYGITATTDGGDS